MKSIEFYLRAVILTVILVVVWIPGFLVSAYLETNKEDVQVVDNRARPEKLEHLILKKEKNIGNSEKGGRIFGAIAGFGVINDGRLVVLDSIDKKVKIVDSSGKVMKEFGREGQGPGEWRNPIMLQLISDRLIMISDPGNRKILYFDLDGSLIKEVSYARKMNIIKIIEDGGKFIASEMGPEGSSIAYTVGKYDGNFNQLFKIDAWLMPLPMGSSKINFFDMIYCFCLDGEGNIIYSRGTYYEIKYFNSEGELFRIVRKEYQPQSITQKDKEEILGMLGRTQGVNMKEMIVFPENYPPFYSFFTDEKNRLYVRTYEKGKTINTHMMDIFNHEGKFIGRCEIPSDVLDLPAVWEADKLYLVEKDDEGYPYIGVYVSKWVR